MSISDLSSGNGDASSSGPMVVLTTGDPVPEVHAKRGSWSKMIHVAAANAHVGPVIDIDARVALPELPESTALVVITGSSAHVHEREPWVVRTEAWLGALVERGVPVFGICFGHQLLAQALGGECSINPRGREFGTIEIETVERDPILEGVSARFRANATHLDTVSRLPKNARALARSARDDHQVIRFTERCYGVQFHPEIDLEVMHGYFDARRAILEVEGYAVDENRALASDAPDAVRVLENFIRMTKAG